jgi:hypothetical protein
MRRRWVVLSSLFALLFAAGSVESQQVRGAVRDSATSQPITGAVVWMADSTGASVGRTIADDAGRYVLGRSAAAVMLNVVRIGYAPRHFAISGGADTTVNVGMQAIPSLLPTVATLSRRVCPGDKGNDQALEVWEQARAALLAGVISRQTRPPRVRLLSYSREMEPVRRRVVELKREAKTLTVDRSYVAARPAWAFASEGYMREERNGDRTFYAPDEETLVDPSFAGTHCLHVVTGDKTHRGQVGIAFEPTHDGDGDTLVDIQGVLWLARGTSALGSLEFLYTNLEPGARGSGGDITFHATPNGAPMIARWSIRSTIVALDLPNVTSFTGVKRRMPSRPDRLNVRILGYREFGGDVASAEWARGQPWYSDFPRITGIVVDSTGQRLAGARVWMSETPDTVTSDAAGEFELPRVFPGLYIVLASDSAWARMGVSRSSPRIIILRQGVESDMPIIVDSRRATLSALCGLQAFTPGTAVLTGRVFGSDGTPIDQPRIELWQGEASIVARRPPERSGDAGGDGRFVLCGLSASQPVLVRASKGRESAEFRVDTWRDDVISVQLTLRRP